MGVSPRTGGHHGNARGIRGLTATGSPKGLARADAARLAGDSTDLRLPLAQRRFHNLHDAAAWIELNWPDFDLETNHPLTWRAGN